MMEEDAQDDVFGMEGGEAVEQKTFRGVDIDDWITLFMQYAIVLTKVEEDPELVNDMFSHLLTSNVVWASDERKLSIHLCWIACGLYSRDYDMLFTALRWVANEFQFHNEPLRLALSLIHATGLHSLERFLNSKDMKFYQRRMRYAEAIAGGIRHYYNPIAQRWVVPQSFLNAGGKKKHNAKNIDPACDEEESGSDDGGAEEEEGEAEDQEQPSPNPTGSFPNPKFEDAEPDEAARVRLGYPTKPSVVGEVFYSYMLLLSASYQPSAGYLARSFAYQQSDPLICLSAAVAFLGRSTNRQTDNRHHMVMQVRLREGKKTICQRRDGSDALSERSPH
ncbi:hypothetical protein IE53DRAFT_23743 [Violaceomyces palustris]|uniref:Uncharacterized protein n=1 Tax=Violaceomyces palustris TaxID=1673888 RepID=A0ACD0NL76_9BASI|nr:hypothetical protein IE53DRAFT_23743 [Violaceomyces palustris]